MPVLGDKRFIISSSCPHLPSYMQAQNGEEGGSNGACVCAAAKVPPDLQPWPHHGISRRRKFGVDGGDDDDDDESYEKRQTTGERQAASGARRTLPFPQFMESFRPPCVYYVRTMPGLILFHHPRGGGGGIGKRQASQRKEGRNTKNCGHTGVGYLIHVHLLRIGREIRGCKKPSASVSLYSAKAVALLLAA